MASFSVNCRVLWLGLQQLFSKLIVFLKGGDDMLLTPESDSEDDLPPGWEERVTLDGRVYYVSHSDQDSQWTHPRSGKKKIVKGDLPFGWEKVVDDDGGITYLESCSGRKTFSDPRLAFAEEESDEVSSKGRYDASSTALSVLQGKDLSAYTAVITGANTGIGYETARSLAFHGCDVVIGCRDLDKGRAAVKKIKSERTRARVTAMEIDLSSLRSVKAFAINLKSKLKQLNILILNAGVFALPWSLTEDGFETIFQVNHLSQMYLCLLLQDLLEKCRNPRVVVLSSESHRFSSLDCNICEEVLSPSSASSFSSLMAYNNSKLCNVWFSRELYRRWCSIRSYSVHPGNMVSSEFSRNWWPYRLLFALVRPFTKSLQQAASTTIYCSVSKDVDKYGGMYFNNCHLTLPSRTARDDTAARRVWDTSVAMITKAMGAQAFTM